MENEHLKQADEFIERRKNLLEARQQEMNAERKVQDGTEVVRTLGSFPLEPMPHEGGKVACLPFIHQRPLTVEAFKEQVTPEGIFTPKEGIFPSPETIRQVREFEAQEQAKDAAIEQAEANVAARAARAAAYAPPPTQRVRWAKSPETALEEGTRIVTGPRRVSYGHPLANHTRTAEVWSWYVRHVQELRGSGQLDFEDVCMLNILQKISRNLNKSDRENIVDIIGFAANIDICHCKWDEDADAAAHEAGPEE